MKVLLTHGYFLHEDEKEQNIMKPYPPLGILGITAWLREHGYQPEVFDTTFSSFDALCAHLLDDPPEVLGIYTNLMTKLRVLDIIRFVRSQKQLASTRIVLGGPEVTYHVEQFLEHGADVVVIGEGEETMRKLLEVWKEGANLKGVEGIALRDEDGLLHRTPPRQLIKAVDTLPFPARDAINLRKYLTAWKERHGTNAISVNTMRGCPYTCRWCSRAVYGNSYRRRSPSVVVDEMVAIRETYNPDTLWFVDDVFTISPKWLRGFAEEVTKREARIPFECITRADRMNEEVVDLLVRSGCYRVWIGAESGSQPVLDAMDRRVTVEQVREMIHLSKQKGLQTGTFIMVGYPGETEEDILATINHLKESAPDHYTITTAYPITGTPFHEQVSDRLTVQPAWEESTDRDLDFKRTYPRRYYDYALRHLYNEVELHRLRQQGDHYARQGMLALKSLIARIGMRRARSD